MHFTPREQEKLLIFLAAELARQRRARGLQLNYPEAVAIISHEIMEGARDGRSVSEMMAFGKRILGPDDVLPGVADMIEEVQVEATFLDGTKLVTVHNPIPSSGDGAPGAFLLETEAIIANESRTVSSLLVANTGDRPIQVGSHFHFAEVNTSLNFTRDQALGMRLNIPAGTAVRFEPGEEKTVELVRFGGAQEIHGFRGLTNKNVGGAEA